MPKKTCTACGAKCSIGLKVCACGLKFKSKSITNWAGVKVPPKARRLALHATSLCAPNRAPTHRQRIEWAHRPPPVPCALALG